MTNLEKYQSMTAEEFVDWLVFVVRGCAGCKADDYSGYCPFEDTCPYMAIYSVYRKDLIKWLESEVEPHE